jgi:hypothetical protein
VATKQHPQFTDQPYWTVIDQQSATRELGDAINRGQKQWRRGVGSRDPRQALLGEMLANVIDAEGGMDYFNLPTQRQGDKPIIKEMIDTVQGQMALLEKVRIDVAFGMADIPLLYGPLYQRIAPPGGFPGGVYQLDEYTLQANVVFLQKFEGGEVQFGTLEKGAPSAGFIQTYAAGFEWTEDMIEFDRTYSIELNNQAFGRAWNALLNHLHLSPIIGFTYAGANSTAANATGATTQEKTHLTFQAAYAKTVNATVRRTGSVLLASESNRFQIEEALLTPVRDAQGNPQVARARRGVFADIGNSSEKITLP